MNIKQKYQLAKVLTMLVPFICSIIFLIHSIHSFFNIESYIFSFLGGTSIIMWLYLLAMSNVFGLCTHHKMFIYYLIGANCIAIIDTLWFIPVSDLEYLIMLLCGFGLAVVLYGVLKFRENKKAKNYS